MKKNLPAVIKPHGEIGFTIHPDNPFKDEINSWLNREKTIDKALVSSTEITVTVKKTYLPGGWVRVYQREDLLHLSPEACKVFMYIAIKMNFDQQKIQLNQAEMGLDRRIAGRAILELLSEGILKQEKRGWYWVNLTMVVMGKINKD